MAFLTRMGRPCGTMLSSCFSTFNFKGADKTLKATSVLIKYLNEKSMDLKLTKGTMLNGKVHCLEAEELRSLSKQLEGVEQTLKREYSEAQEIVLEKASVGVLIRAERTPPRED